LTNNEEENNSEKIKAIEDLELSKIESVPLSTSNRIYKSLEYEKTIDSDILQNADSCLTTVPSSQDISNNENVYSPCVQATTIEEINVEVLNNNLSKEVVNNDAAATVTKRKLSKVYSIVNDDSADPFEYIDFNEIEKKAKKRH